MFDISVWIDEYMSKLDATFGERAWFAGLQGSYRRDEANENSDIDMVVILDELSTADIEIYNNMLDTLPYRELTCGFLSGKEEILCWEPSDLFHLYYDTKPIKGSLDDLLLLIDNNAVERAIKIGACNIYHGCVHNMLYDKNEDILCELFKSAAFVIQEICFIETGKFFGSKKELFKHVSGAEKEVLDTYLRLKQSENVNFTSMSETLFNWSQKIINTK